MTKPNNRLEMAFKETYGEPKKRKRRLPVGFHLRVESIIGELTDLADEFELGQSRRCVMAVIWSLETFLDWRDA